MIASIGLKITHSALMKLLWGSSTGWSQFIALPMVTGGIPDWLVILSSRKYLGLMFSHGVVIIYYLRGVTNFLLNSPDHKGINIHLWGFKEASNTL